MTGRVDGKGKKRGLRRVLRAPLLIGAAASAGLLIAPTVSSAFANHFDASPVSLAARGGIGSFTPASIDPRLAAQITVRALSNGKLFRFTPAVSVRQAFAAAATTPGAATVRIAPTAYNLGLARGYQSFAIDGSQPREVARLEMPDFQAFKLSGPAPTAPGRLSPRLELDQKERAGRAPRTLENQGDYQVDLGGSYRLTGNLNVMAGIRYSSERDRLRPLTDGKQDSQAVYVGTQFHF